MRHTDIAIVGGGIAGSATAAILGRMEHDAILIDLHATYPPDFRCEKVDQSQLRLVARAGLEGDIRAVSESIDCIWVCRNGRLVEKYPTQQACAPYDTLVNALRRAVSRTVSTLTDKVTAIELGPHRQVISLAGGDRISARLVVMASGLNNALRSSLGFGRDEISPAHSIGVGFDVVPPSGAEFPFRALTYYPETVKHGVAYLTLFPFRSVKRANLFIYRDKHDPWLTRMRTAPQEALLEVLPKLMRMTGPFVIPRPAQVRPADLYLITNRHRDGIVLIGDAAGTTCPAAGTGLNKVFTDVERLCNVYIPQWLRTPGMDASKIAGFYADPEKQATDAMSLERAFGMRQAATDTSLRWRLRRQVRHFLGQRVLDAIRKLRPQRSPAMAGAWRMGERH
jgi:2-polyprenyl-6-methoxyphenol hydroxylase-like FAD-dependent oxidoreductase